MQYLLEVEFQGRKFVVEAVTSGYIWCSSWNLLVVNCASGLFGTPYINERKYVL